MTDAGLLFGVASGAMHVEGAVDADGRTPSVWDAVDGLLDRDIEPGTPGMVRTGLVRVDPATLDRSPGLRSGTTAT